ncbi:GFA family protein [Pseudomonas sp. JDS28PS106]|uniref:GFA family protein n=1 Tax=Pseudomonas sp. JDS28PS106 TaxID=2497235 RepID=UPI002FD3BDF3
MSSEQCECLCGAVKFEVTLDNHKVGVCHCGMCRRWAGGPSMMVETSQPPHFADSGSVRVHSSSDWAERGFCAECGSHLFYRMKDGGFYGVPVGLFKQAGQPWSFEMEVFIEEKPDFYAFANDTQKLTGAELFAQHGADSQDN